MAILQQAYSSFSTITMAGVQELLLLTQHQTVSLLPLPLVSALAAAARRNAALALLLRVRARVRVRVRVRVRDLAPATVGSFPLSRTACL